MVYSTFLSILVIAALVLGHSVRAYPPAPHHTIFGLVRDQFGNPLRSSAEIILETSSGISLQTKISPGLQPGVNYELEVPMDAGMTSDLYKPTAMRPTVAFKVKVKIGKITYLPIEMSGDFSRLGLPGHKTLLNLTLGEDLDGDGIPDDWERLLLASRGGNGTIGDINPNDDADGDHLSNLNEYLAGTYAFDDENGFTLKMVRIENAHPVLEFMAVRGRTYSVLGTQDLVHWTPVQFKLDPGSDILPAYYAADTRVIQIEAIRSPGQKMLVYKLLAQ